MTHSQVAAIEAREQRIAHLERRLQERENTVSLMADELAFVAVRAVELRKENEYLRRAVRARGQAVAITYGPNPLRA